MITRRLSDENGTALLLAIVLVMMLAAIGAAAILGGQTETLISANFRQGREALYVAEGAVNRALQDLADLPDWTPALAGTVSSTFVDGSPTGVKILPSGGTTVLCCGSSSLGAALQARGYGGSDWGTDTPQWQLYSWGAASAWLPGDAVQSAFYTAAWVSDDPGDADGNARTDTNGILTVAGVAIGPNGARRTVQAMVQRVPAAAETAPRVRLLSWIESRW